FVQSYVIFSVNYLVILGVISSAIFSVPLSPLLSLLAYRFVLSFPKAILSASLCWPHERFFVHRLFIRLIL
uniref:Uncharacterized protein n=2 Tax=Aegilops tauschii subsp. strangulata TaxID=200361 RepID=A0A453JKC9_AEGTS